MPLRSSQAGLILPIPADTGRIHALRPVRDDLGNVCVGLRLQQKPRREGRRRRRRHLRGGRAEVVGAWPRRWRRNAPAAPTSTARPDAGHPLPPPRLPARPAAPAAVAPDAAATTTVASLRGCRTHGVGAQRRQRRRRRHLRGGRAEVVGAWPRRWRRRRQRRRCGQMRRRR